MAFCLNNVALIYQSQGDKIRAKEYLDRTLEAWKELDYKDGIASSLNNLGNLSFEMGNSTKRSIIIHVH